jgi:hypothetical protein
METLSIFFCVLQEIISYQILGSLVTIPFLTVGFLSMSSRLASGGDLAKRDLLTMLGGSFCLFLWWHNDNN